MKRLLQLLSFICLCALPTYSFAWAGNKTEAAQERAILALGYKLGKQNQMEFQNWGVGSVVDSPVTAYDMNFISRGRLVTLEQARPIAFQMLKAFLNDFFFNPVYATQMRAVHQALGWYDPTVKAERVGMKISFWDENINRPLFPYVSQVKIFDGKVHYYYASPKDQSLQEPPVMETIAELFSKMGEAMPTPPQP